MKFRILPGPGIQIWDPTRSNDFGGIDPTRTRTRNTQNVLMKKIFSFFICNEQKINELKFTTVYFASKNIAIKLFNTYMTINKL